MTHDHYLAPEWVSGGALLLVAVGSVALALIGVLA